MDQSESTVTFIANAAGNVVEDESIVTGVQCTSDGRYLNFSRSLPIEGEDDCGIYSEFSDQINSGYNLINRCVLSRSRLQVTLREPIDRTRKITGFDVELCLADDEWNALASSLRLIFEGHEQRLSGS